MGGGGGGGGGVSTVFGKQTFSFECKGAQSFAQRETFSLHNFLLHVVIERTFCFTFPICKFAIHLLDVVMATCCLWVWPSMYRCSMDGLLSYAYWSNKRSFLPTRSSNSCCCYFGLASLPFLPHTVHAFHHSTYSFSIHTCNYRADQRY